MSRQPQSRNSACKRHVNRGGDYAWKEDIGGKVGLWSKADSYVFFDNFMVETR